MEKSLMYLLLESTKKLGIFVTTTLQNGSLTEHEVYLLNNFIESQEDLAKKIVEVKNSLG